jgi:hypothetical protein
LSRNIFGKRCFTPSEGALAYRRQECNQGFPEVFGNLFLMGDPVRVFPDLERSFPRMLNLIDKPISATLTKKQGEFFINVLLQLLRI